MSDTDKPSRPPTIVACPTCGKDVPWQPGSTFKPFCSDRCRLIDLGAWADGSYSIPAEPVNLDDDADNPLPH